MAKGTTPAFSWWGERWMQYLEVHAGLPEMTPGKFKGAQRGEARLEVSRGKVVAIVGDSWASHTATLKVKALGQRDWKKLIEGICERPEVARRLLAGTPGPELETALAAMGVELFPEGVDLRCNCHEHCDCRHRRVLAVRGAALFDANPFAWLEALGMRREELLAAVRAKQADQVGLALAEGARAPGAGPAALLALGGGLAPERFLTAPGDPDAIAVRAGETATPDALLKVLGSLPLPPEVSDLERWVVVEETRNGYPMRWHDVVTDSADVVLGRYLEQISRVATGLATGEITPHFAADDGVPGKKVLAKTRLADEIAEAVLDRGEPVRIEALMEECPTAASLRREEAETALNGALLQMPEEFVVLAGRSVALRASVLAGLTFRHPVSFLEWRRGRLSMDADWARTLALAGFAPPYEIQVGGELCLLPDDDRLFQILAPEMGDQLVLTVADPSRPLLVATLRRRGEAGDDRLFALDQAAGAAIADEMQARRRYELPESFCLEMLLAEGFCRGGRAPDPVWLLGVPLQNRPLDWGANRTLRWRGWYYGAGSPAFREQPRGAWVGRQQAIGRFCTALKEAGKTPAEVANAMDCVVAWSQRWHGNQTDVAHPPAVGVFADFLWNEAPALAVKRRGLGEATFPRALGAWFRFLAGDDRRALRAYADLLALCDLEEMYLRRLRTLAAWRGAPEAFGAWVVEGYRWLGPELVLG
ncbi:MAG: hypothetical protein K0R39_316 [Symbiobacteriaceae bacterium]|jgi:uncharacterized Zn finger protein|nr:hypothetical protein [Symbiobacteriaceae bacterium]